MELIFEYCEQATTGSNPAILHDIDGKLKLFVARKETIDMLEMAPGPSWNDREFSGETTVATDDHEITNFSIRSLPFGIQWFTWQSELDRMLARWPYDDSKPYEVTDAYRLYYAVDTEKLYMNINQRWRFIATPRHDLLRGVGTMSHRELEQKIAELEARIEALENN